MPHSSGKLSILFLGSSPNQWQPLELTREFNELSRELDARCPSRFELHSRWGEPATSLPDLLDDYRPQILHFSGHGNELGGLVFEDEHGEPHTPAPETIAEVFAKSKGVVRCVVLNACFSEPQARLIAVYVDCVVGLHDRIADEDAIAFTQAFYSSIGRGLSLATAFDKATLQLSLRGTESPAVLIHRGASSELASMVLLPSSVDSSHGASPVRTGSLSARSPRQIAVIVAASFVTPLCVGILARDRPGGEYIIIAACLLVPIVILAALTRNHIALAGSIYAGVRSLDYSSRVALASSSRDPSSHRLRPPTRTAAGVLHILATRVGTRAPLGA